MKKDTPNRRFLLVLEVVIGTPSGKQTYTENLYVTLANKSEKAIKGKDAWIQEIIKKSWPANFLNYCQKRQERQKKADLEMLTSIINKNLFGWWD